MRYNKLLTTLAIILLPAAAMCQLVVEPFGFAIAVDVNDEMIVELNLINIGEDDIEVNLHAVRPRVERDRQNRGPRRDDLGDIIDEFRIDGGLWAGLAWDGELMWGLDYDRQQLTCVNLDGEIVDNINIEGNVHIGLCFDGEAFWIGYIGDEREGRIFHLDREGDVFEEIRVEGGPVFGVAWDGENLWYTGLMWGEDRTLRQCDTDGDNLRRIDCNNLEESWTVSPAWVEMHEEGHIWILSGEDPHLWQINVEDDRAEIIQDTQLNQSLYGIEHDGFNLWLNGEGQTWYVMDDGIEEVYLVSIEPESGVVPGNNELNVDVIITSQDAEEGVYPFLINIETDLEDMPLIEIAAVVSVASPTATVIGVITDATDNVAIAGTQIDMDEYIIQRFSNHNGNYTFADLPLGDYEFTFTAEDYLPLIEEVNIDEEGEFELNVALLHAECNLVGGVNEVDVTLRRFEEEHIGIQIFNGGNGPLTYTTERRLPGGADANPWDLRESLLVGQPLEDNRLEGVVFDGEHYIISGANKWGRIDEPDVIYILDRDGELLDTLPQPGALDGSNGMRDLAWDGELIWGSGCSRIAGITLEGEVATVFDGPYGINQALAWDPDRELLWVSTITQGIAGVNRETGEVVATIDRKGLRVYSLAYWEYDPDGHPLYIFHNPQGGRQHVHKMNPDNGDTIFVADLGSQVEGSAGGAFITNQFDPYSWVFIDIANDGDDDRIDMWQLDRRRDWITIDPDAGQIAAGESQMFDLGIIAELPPGDYEAQLVFLHDGVGGETAITILLNIIGGPPAPFNLLEPEDEDTLYTGEERTFTWEPAIDPDPEDEVSYLLCFQTGDDSIMVALDENSMDVLPDTGFFNVDLETQFNWWVCAGSEEEMVECNDRFSFLLMQPRFVATPETDLPTEFTIRSIHPNPFNAQTRISYSLNRTSRTVLRVIDFTGREVAAYDYGIQAAGYHHAVIDAASLPSGIYIAQLTAGDEVRIGKLVCIR